MCFQMFTDVFHLFPPVTCQSSIILSEQHHSIVTKTYFKITVESTAEYSPTTWKYWLHIFRYYYTCILCSHNTFRLMNVVTLRYAWLVPRWVTIFGRVNHFDAEPGTQAYSASACPLCRLKWVPGESWGSKQAYHMTHQPVSVVSQCSLIAWSNELASGDQRRLTENVSALEACLRRCAIQMAAFTLLTYLLYFYNVRTFSSDTESEAYLPHHCEHSVNNWKFIHFRHCFVVLSHQSSLVVAFT